MQDETLNPRRAMVEELNQEPLPRKGLEELYGEVWDSVELQNTWEVMAFLAPFVVVKNRLTKERGTLCFQHRPRFYFSYLKAPKK
jgi:hypothetical protein